LRTKKTLLTIRETMEKLSVSRSTLHRLAASGELPCCHIGRAVRFHKDVIDSFLGRLMQQEAEQKS